MAFCEPAILQTSSTSLVVLLQVHPQGIAFFPFKGDAPGTIDMEAVSLRLSMEWMEVEAGDVQIGESLSVVQSIESP